MRTDKYKNALLKIVTFCKATSNGLIVAEINNKATVTEFAEDLNSEFKIHCVKYDELVVKDLNSITSEYDIFLIYGVITNEKDLVINLNYNRNWFLGLNIKIIFILPSFVIDELISYSANFWSCVALHEDFNAEFNCMMKPCFIDTIYNSVNPIFRKTMSLGSITSYVWGRKINIRSGNYNDIRIFFDNIYKNSKKTTKEDVLKHFIEFMQLCYYNAMFKYVTICAGFIVEKKDLVAVFDNVGKYVFFDLCFNSNFYLKNYYSSLNFLNQLIKLQQTDKQTFGNKLMSIYYNDLGVLLILLKEYKIALSVLDIAYNDNDPYSSLVLYNLSLISYTINDYKNATYYISKAIEHIPNIDSQGYETTRESYKILEAYIKINRGDILGAKNIIFENLHLLRSKGDEFQYGILEAHYVYAVIYLYNGDFDKSLNCAEKSLNIASVLKCNDVKPYIYELIGEINYENKNYVEAKKYLSIAAQKNTHNQYFNNDVFNWMKDTILICNEKIV